MAVRDKATYTADDLWQIISQEGTDARYELIDGELIDMSPSSFLSSEIGADLLFAIKAYVMQHDLGRVTNADGGFQLSPKDVLAPDVGFISKARAVGHPARWFIGPPDLAVEVVSPTDRPGQVKKKVARYLAFKVPLVWVVKPKNRTVEVHTTAGMTVLHEGDTLDGGDVLPGFTLAVKDVFVVLDR